LRSLKILLVAQMYPGSDHPDLGAYVRQLEEQLLSRSHVVKSIAIDRRKAGLKANADFGLAAVGATRTFKPDVIYAHFLAPAGLFGLFAARASRAPLVVTAHGQDVRNVGVRRWAKRATPWVVDGATNVVAVSDYLRAELESFLPEAAAKTVVINCGVDLEQFKLSKSPNTPTAYLFIGSLIERKNVLLLAEAFQEVRLPGETLTFVGDGDLRPQLENRPGVRICGRVHPRRVASYIANSHVVCLPSSTEPLGQVLLEAMACGRSVVATNVGGPREFIPEGAGLLVDPTDRSAIGRALRAAAELPRPNMIARAAAERHDVRRKVDQIEAIFARAIGA
jgi:glycosyltransferase involved in cell wall biosynthesis